MAGAAGTGNTAPTLTTVTVLLLIWATISYSIRIYVKLRKSDAWGADDVAISVAAFALLLQAVAIFYSVHQGYGNSWHSLSSFSQQAIAKTMYAAQILYISSTGFTRISSCLFTANILTRDERNVKIARGTVGVCAAWIVASIFAVALRGNLGSPYWTFDGTQAMFVRWLVIEVIGLGIDILGLALATYFVSTLQMAIGKKLVILSIINCRLVLAVPIAIRLYFLVPHHARQNPQAADIVTEIVMGAAIMLASITCLKPFLAPFDPQAFGTNASRSGLFRYSAEPQTKRSERYYELSGQRSATRPDREWKNGTMESTRSVGSGSGKVGQEDEQPLTNTGSGMKLRADGAGHIAQAQSVPLGRFASNAGSSGKNISKTQSWTVSVNRSQG